MEDAERGTKSVQGAAQRIKSKEVNTVPSEEKSKQNDLIFLQDPMTHLPMRRNTTGAIRRQRSEINIAERANEPNSGLL